MAGQLLVKSGAIDERTIEKYKAEAIANKRKDWYLAYRHFCGRKAT
jgi:translation elongation factor EF-1alpha